MNDLRWWWLSTMTMTVAVGVRDGVIEATPPLVRKFKGQPLKNLALWMGKQEGFKIRSMEADLDQHPFGYKKGEAARVRRGNRDPGGGAGHTDRGSRLAQESRD